MKSLSLLVLLFSLTVCSQNKQLLYGFSEIPQSTLINPAEKLNNQWYIGIPLLSHIHAGFGMSGLSAYDLFADNKEAFSMKLNRVVTSMKHTDMFGINQQLELFNGGFALGKSYESNQYITFGMYQETDFIFYYPKDIIDLAYKGNGTTKRFDFGHLNFQAELLSVLHLGYARKVNNSLSVGVRGKIYSSIFNMKSTNNSGTFITRTNNAYDSDSFYTHVFDLDLQLQSSGVFSLLNDENSNVSNDVSTLRNRFLLGGNLGLGIDLGVVKQLNKQTQIDASVQDLGVIWHRKDIENYKINNYLEYSGIQPKFDGVAPGQTAEDYWSKFIEDFEALKEIDTTRTRYITLRPVKLNAALRYKFDDSGGGASCNCEGTNNLVYKNEIGGQLFVITRPIRPQMAVTGYYYRRLGNAFRAKATYTIDSYSYSNVGLGVSAHFFGVNFYIMGDNLIRLNNLAKTQSQSLQLGFNYIFKNH